MNYYVLFFIGFYAFLYSSCSTDDKALNKFFISFEKELRSRDLQKLKDSSIDSAIYYFEGLYEEYQVAAESEILNNDRVYRYLNNLDLEDYGIPDHIFLGYEFYSYLNDTSYELDDYAYFYKAHLVMDVINTEKRENELQEMIIAEKETWNIKDTLSLIFPVSEEYFGKTIVERIYPHTKEIYSFEDTLKLRGILLDKRYDSTDVWFKLKIVSISDEDVLVFGEKYRSGDDFEFSLRTYGRPIN